jgi:hypothetical protein
MSFLRRRGRRLRAKDLTYAAYARCPCGAGLAYAPGDDCWDCSSILLREAAPSGTPLSVTHIDRYPFRFWSIMSEHSVRAEGATTRPTKLQGATA